MDEIRLLAKKEAEDFLKNDSEYRMGFIEAEKPHPVTKRMSQTYAESTVEGAKLIFKVDEQMSERASKTLAGKEFCAFADKIRETVKSGHKVIFSGCGSSGRLSMRIEASWREAILGLCEKYPEHKKALLDKIESVRYIMTGGDYAVIRAAEAFEDSPLLGEKQAEEMGVGKGDLLIGVTATGETTSILGTARYALKNGASVYMLICSEPTRAIEKMQRVREVFTHENCSYMLLDCGAMALTGSTRMQSSTYEQLAGMIALEGAICDILETLGIPTEKADYKKLAEGFMRLCKSMKNEKLLSSVARLTDKEKEYYSKGAKVTYFSDEYLLDVLTDTTERAPTFMTPPFRPSDMTSGEESWAFVKNPTCSTAEAWNRCFLRTPNCIEWTRDKYESFGMTERQISKIPPIGLEALKKFEIGNEPSSRREGKENLAIWVDFVSAPQEFHTIASKYGEKEELAIGNVGIEFEKTYMKMYEHLFMKMMLNTISTGSMALMGRITGNWMTSLAMSNKKLTDRSARIVSDVCNVPYEAALEEVFYAYEYCEANNINRSPAAFAIEKFSKK